MDIPFSRVVCDGNELKYVREVLDSGWLTTASKAQELERRFAEAVGAKHACAVNSCTAAMHLALEALGVGPGDHVLVPTMTFTASAEVVRYLGADPVFLDVDYATGLVTPAIVAEALKRYPKAKALMVVHFAGQAAEMTEVRGQRSEVGRLRKEATACQGSQGAEDGERKGILDICREYGLKVVEDAAHAFPSRLNGRMVGSFGDATCFSFYANKTITTGEGGMLVSDDEALVRRARVMRLHGIDRDIWNRYTSETPSWEYDVIAPGFKYNMPDLNAAVGLAQLERAEQLRQARQQCAMRYMQELAGITGLDLPVLRVRPEDHAWHLFPVVLTDKAPIRRNDFIARMADRGIGTSVHFKPLHRMTYYRDRYGLKPESFPNAERIWLGRVSLPIYASLAAAEQSCVIGAVMECVSNSSCHVHHDYAD